MIETVPAWQHELQITYSILIHKDAFYKDL